LRKWALSKEVSRMLISQANQWSRRSGRPAADAPVHFDKGS
jgi:hypothetical protein